MKWFKSNLLIITGAITGSIGGFLYWKYVGCATGTCVITPKPVNSSLYGAMMGGLLFSIFKPNQKIKNNDI